MQQMKSRCSGARPGARDAPAPAPTRAAATRRWHRAAPARAAQQQAAQQLAPLPTEYPQAVRQAQAAMKAALADGVKLLEVGGPDRGWRGQGRGGVRGGCPWCPLAHSAALCPPSPPTYPVPPSCRQVELPTLSLTASQGDGEGQNEMNASMELMRKALVAFQDRAPSIRVFFPDQMELAVARSGQTSDPSAGRKALDAQFEGARSGPADG
jgi:hypothetical protein